MGERIQQGATEQLECPCPPEAICFNSYGFWDQDFLCGLHPSESEVDLGVMESPAVINVHCRVPPTQS